MLVMSLSRIWGSDFNTMNDVGDQEKESVRLESRWCGMASCHNPAKTLAWNGGLKIWIVRRKMSGPIEYVTNSGIALISGTMSKVHECLCILLGPLSRGKV